MADARTPASPSARKVMVILSTFNGSAFLGEQLNSLYAQTYPAVTILVRDDGSSDTTRDVLERAEAEGRIKVLPGHENLGAAGSYFKLLQFASASEADFIAFCDQDDVWQPEKISHAVTQLSAVPRERAAMYSSRLDIVDAELAPMSVTALPKKIGFGNALVENVCVGCTIVLNRAAVDLICRKLPARALVHDWWCYLVLSCFGEIVFDRTSHIKYRQHAGNVFGAATGKLDRIKRNVRRFAGNSAGRHWQSEQAAMFATTFGNSVPARERAVLEKFIGARSIWRQRLALALSGKIWRQRRLDDLLMRMLILIGRY